MGRKNLLASLVMILGMSACVGGSWQTQYNAPIEVTMSSGWRLNDVQVSVPESLTVSNQNTLAPNADIVWHGEALGDRRAQVAALIAEGVTRGASGLRGNQIINISVKLHTFHAVTPAAIARAPNAVHNIGYDIQVFDANTDQALSSPQFIEADLEAYVGAGAILAAQQGQSQKTRISDHLARVTAGWLSIGPDQRRSFSGLGR